MRGAAKLICTPLPRREVLAGTPRILAPLELFAIRETLAGMAVDTPGEQVGSIFWPEVRSRSGSASAYRNVCSHPYAAR